MGREKGRFGLFRLLGIIFISIQRLHRRPHNLLGRRRSPYLFPPNLLCQSLASCSHIRFMHVEVRHQVYREARISIQSSVLTARFSDAGNRLKSLRLLISGTHLIRPCCNHFCLIGERGLYLGLFVDLENADHRRGGTNPSSAIGIGQAEVTRLQRPVA